MSDELKPALSAEEWALPNGPARQHIWDHGGLEQLIAVANAALPDDSPYKITRADVEELESVAADAINAARWSERDVAPLRAIAAKIAALLPP